MFIPPLCYHFGPKGVNLKIVQLALLSKSKVQQFCSRPQTAIALVICSLTKAQIVASMYLLFHLCKVSNFGKWSHISKVRLTLHEQTTNSKESGHMQPVKAQSRARHTPSNSIFFHLAKWQMIHFTLNQLTT